MEYKFKIWIDGNYYYEDEEFEKVIDLSDREVATIKKLISEYFDEFTPGLMPILEEGSKELYQKFHDAVFPHVFFELFKRDPCFEPEPGDEGREWNEDKDVNYLMETYGDGYDFDDAYIVYIPDEMMPPKVQLSKVMSKDDILRYIRIWNSMRKDLFMNICYTDKHSISNVGHDTLYTIIESKLTAIIEKALEDNEESTLCQDNFNPFENVDINVLSDEIYNEFQTVTGG